MTAGRRDQLITLQRFSAEQDEYGEPTGNPTWTTLATEWAAVFYGRGDERRQAAMEQGQQPASFEMLSNETTRTLTLRDRIVLDGVEFDIVGIAPDTPKRGTISLTGARAA